MTHTKRIITIDCEASGMGKESYPIEIGFALEDGSTQSYLIKPEPEWVYWDQYAEDHVHKISRKMLFDEGIDAYTVASMLNQQLEVVYSDALKFDARWINRLYETVGLERTFEIRSMFEFIKKTEKALWYDERRKLFAKTGQHRAGVDAWVNQEAYVLLQNIYAERIRNVSNED